MSLANKLRLATRLPMTEKMLAVFSASFVQHLQQSLFGSLSEEETDARLRKIRRAKDLDEAEQRFKALSEKRDYLWLKRDYLERLLYGDNFCEE